ncbi:MAG: hypothetical protein AB7V42_14185 [Thermoleophilia bacterium]
MGLIGVTAGLAAAVPATAAVTSVVNGQTVIITSDNAGDVINPRCTNGQLRLAGEDLIACAVVEAITVEGGGGADVLDMADLRREDLPELFLVHLVPGTGADQVQGSPVRDVIEADAFDVVFAGPGSDTVRGGGQVSGGPGADLIDTPLGPVDGGDGDDRIRQAMSVGVSVAGGAGRDTVELDWALLPSGDYSFAVADAGLTIDAPGLGTSALLPWSGVERVEQRLPVSGAQLVDGRAFGGALVVEGREGADTILGGPGDDTLSGGDGNDVIEGGGGIDLVDGGAGADVLRLRDGGLDRADCGADGDAVEADAADLLAGCEAIDVPPSPAAPVADTAAPTLGVGAATLKGRRLSLRLKCPAGEVRCAVSVMLKAQGRRGGRTIAKGLGRLTTTLPGGASKTVTRTLGAAQARSLAGLTRLRLRPVVRVADAAGNARTQTPSLALARR